MHYSALLRLQRLLSGSFVVFILLTASQACSWSQPVARFACVYPAANGVVATSGDVVGVDDCGHFDDEGAPVFAGQSQGQILQAAKNNLICVYVGTQQGSYRVFYFYNDRHFETVFYDNGCDYFQEGLTRVFHEGKTVFVDPQLNIILSPGTEIATGFWAGHAVVCNGNFRAEEVGASTLEDSGNCGMIDHQGKLVLPLEYSLESEVFEQYILANNGCPSPPVVSAEQALCHVRWLGKVHQYIPEVEYDSKVLELANKWQITLISKRAREKFIIEIRRDTAQMIIMQRQPIQG